MHRPIRPLAILLAAALALGLPGRAAPAPDQDPLVARAIDYLEGLGDVKGQFRQIGPRGDVALGTLWLARPGRARFQYDAPSDLLITSDGRTVIVSDARLKTFQATPLGATPLAVFLADHIRLDRGVRIGRVDTTQDGFSITARDARGLAQGELTLYFVEGPLRLGGWAIRDPAGRVTRVSLGPLAEVPPPPPGFFTQSRQD